MDQEHYCQINSYYFEFLYMNIEYNFLFCLQNSYSVIGSP